MSEVYIIEKIVAAVKEQMEANKDKVAAMSEAEREKYVEELLYKEFKRMLLH
jgi:hypothetical protein